MSFSKPKDESEFMRRLKATTTARIGIGHSGGRYCTYAQLKFKEDLAISRDAVRREVTATLIHSLGLKSFQSKAPDRSRYLMDSSMGRFLCEPDALRLAKEVANQPDVQLIVSDGLSSEAFEQNVPRMLPLLLARLKEKGIRTGDTVFVRWARVGVIDHVGEILKPKASLILIGERPGLGISDSLSGYFEFEPSFKRVESDRNVLSNIHNKGIPPEEASIMLADALVEVLRLKKSGMSVRFDFA